jgi:hypothetical protein
MIQYASNVIDISQVRWFKVSNVASCTILPPELLGRLVPAARTQTFSTHASAFRESWCGARHNVAKSFVGRWIHFAKQSWQEKKSRLCAGVGGRCVGLETLGILYETLLAGENFADARCVNLALHSPSASSSSSSSATQATACSSSCCACPAEQWKVQVDGYVWNARRHHHHHHHLTPTVGGC